MTSQLKALRELADKVEAGGNLDIDLDFQGITSFNQNSCIFVMKAYNGSLDAADLLHKAVIPTWNINLGFGYCHVIPPYDNGDQDACSGFNSIMARAWLVAIIHAKIAELEEK